MTATETRTPMPGHVLELPVDAIRPDPNQPRKALGDIDGLAASIEAVGLQQPVLVRADPDQAGQYLLIAGERRWTAHGPDHLNRLTIPAILRTADDDALRLVAQLVENSQRLDLDPIEEANAYAQLTDPDGHNWTQAQVARAVGKSEAHVSRRLALRQVPPLVQRLVTAGEVKIDTAVALAKLTRDGKTGAEQAGELIVDLEESLKDLEDARERGDTREIQYLNLDDQLHHGIDAARAEVERQRAIDDAEAVVENDGLKRVVSWLRWENKYRKPKKGEKPTHAYIDPNTGKLTRLVAIKKSERDAMKAAEVERIGGRAPGGVNRERLEQRRVEAEQIRGAHTALLVRLVRELPRDDQALQLARYIVTAGAEELPYDRAGAIDLLGALPRDDQPLASFAETSDRAMVQAAFAQVTAGIESQIEGDIESEYRHVLAGWGEAVIREHYRLLCEHGYTPDPIELTYLGEHEL